MRDAPEPSHPLPTTAQPSLSAYQMPPFAIRYRRLPTVPPVHNTRVDRATGVRPLSGGSWARPPSSWPLPVRRQIKEKMEGESQCNHDMIHPSCCREASILYKCRILSLPKHWNKSCRKEAKVSNGAGRFVMHDEKQEVQQRSLKQRSTKNKSDKEMGIRLSSVSMICRHACP